MRSTRAVRVLLAPLTLAFAAFVAPVRAQSPGGVSVYVVPIAARAADTDVSYASALAAACANGGLPLVLAVDARDPWRPELLDFLRRAEPEQLIQLGALPPPPPPWDSKVRATAAQDATAIACELAERFAGSCETAVLSDPSDRAATLCAAVLAARMGAPFLPCERSGVSEAVNAQLARLGVSAVLTVGTEAPTRIAGLRVERLADGPAVAAKLTSAGKPVEYIAAVQAEDDRLEHAAQLSLAGALLAAARNGAVAVVPGDVRWKQRVEAAPLAKSPKGAFAAANGLRRGEVENGKRSLSFVVGIDPADGRPFAQFDANGDGDFADKGEEALRTGAEIVLGGRRHSIDLDADEKARGQALWLTAPTAQDIVESVQRVRAAARSAPGMLCLVGWPDAIPMAIVGSAAPIDADLVSDLALAQTDADPFVDLAFARFAAEDLASATLQACRGLAAPTFRDRSHARRFATAEWGSGGVGPMLVAAGMTPAGHHAGDDFIADDSPLTRVELLQHGSHAAWTQLGKTYEWSSRVLLAPCLVESSGCSTAALDMDAERRSAPLRMLRNGALAFAGNRRRGTAQQELFRTEFLNAVLAGQSLGEAHRSALNRVLVALLDGTGVDANLVRYQLHAATVFGDPALRFDFASNALPPGARVELRNSMATVVGPKEWFRSEYAPLEEWKCPVDKLHAWRAVGVGVDSAWFGPRNRNEDRHVFTAEVRSRRRFERVQAVDDARGELGFSGRAFVDEHEDGERSLYWRVRLVESDAESGELRSERRSAQFRLLER